MLVNDLPNTKKVPYQKPIVLQETLNVHNHSTIRNTKCNTNTPAKQKQIQLLDIFLLNIQGINPNIPKQKGKMLALREEVIASENLIPFFALTETHINETHFDAEVSIPNYEIIRSDRINRQKGGVALYLHHTITINDEEKFSDPYCQAVVVYIKNSNLILAVVYRPPNTPEKSFENCIKKIKLFSLKYDRADQIITGDFNFRFINWEQESITKKGIPVSEQKQALHFLNYTNQMLLTQMVAEYTRKDKSILDLVLSTDPEIIQNIHVEKTSKSDHDVVRCQIVCPTLQSEKYIVAKSDQEKRQLDTINLNKADWHNIRGELKNIKWDEIIEEDGTVSNMYNVFEEITSNARRT